MRRIAGATTRSRIATVVRTCVAVGLVTGVVTVAAPSSAATLWRITPSPSPYGPPIGELSAVSCSSPTSCFAVGSQPDGADNVSANRIERWDGTSWSLIPSPTPVGRASKELHAVSCSTPTSCFAVGDFSTARGEVLQTLTERWDGATWTIVSSPEPLGASQVALKGVSCSSPTSCFAVGSWTPRVPKGPLTVKPLIERWNGTTWSLIANPNPTGSTVARLNGVSCATATSCFAVGARVAKDNTGGALVEHWNGTSWSIVATPTPPAGSGPAIVGVTPVLDGVSCPSPASCFAVGFTATDSLTERWDGSAWSIVAAPVPPGVTQIAELSSVSCATSTNCVAVGGTLDASTARADDTPEKTIAEHWDGVAWSIVAAASGAPLTELTSVSCAQPTSCAAVGDSTLVEQWDGTSWTLAPLAEATSLSELTQVSCPSPTNCFAVGDYSSTTSINTLAEHWDGASWSILPSPNPDGTNVSAVLTAVSCPTPTTCIAVGSYSSSTTDQSMLVESWNGASWTVVAVPNPKGAVTTALSGVACPTATNCKAVGSYDVNTAAGSATRTLAAHWNGSTWSIALTPNPKLTQDAELLGVSCVSAKSCTAVGTYDRAAAGLDSLALAERWDGTRWTIVATPALSEGDSATLLGVSCPTTTNCTAVGSRAVPAGGGSGPGSLSLVERWNGKTWSIVDNPNPISTKDVQLSSVSCRSAASCWAVGSFTRAVRDTMLLEHWDGATWTITSIAKPPGATGGTALTSVTCPSATSCFTVGRWLTFDSSFTLAERAA